MPGVLAWGYYPTDKIWLPIQVDANGRIKADMSAINLDDLADVDLTGLADDDFMYYDLATGLWKPRKLIDADIPATICRDSELAIHAALPDVHHATHLKTLADHPLSIIPTMDDDHIPAAIARDAEVATAVSDHAALTTGVHGAGANYLALAAAAAHLVRAFTKGWTLGKLLKGGGVNINPTEISGWETIAEVVVPSNTTYVDFTNLDINTDRFYELFLTVKNTAGASIHLLLFINGDYTSTNYYNQYLIGYGPNLAYDRENNSKITWVDTAERMFGHIYITRDPDGYFRYIGVSSPLTGSSVRRDDRGGTKTATVINITSIRIQSDVADGIGAGSVLLLCRPRSA